MRFGRTTCMIVAVLMVSAVGFAQEDGGERGGGRRGGGQGGRGPGGGMEQVREMFQVMGSVRALRSVGRELDEDQRAQLKEALDKMVARMKEAQTEFEASLAQILTAEQMAIFNEAKSQGPRRGGRGGQGGRRGQGEGQGGGRGARRGQQ